MDVGNVQARDQLGLSGPFHCAKLRSPRRLRFPQFGQRGRGWIELIELPTIHRQGDLAINERNSLFFQKTNLQTCGITLRSGFDIPPDAPSRSHDAMTPAAGQMLVM